MVHLRPSTLRPMQWLVQVLALASLAACTGTIAGGSSAGGDDDDGPEGPCASGATRCDGQTVETCMDGSYVTTDTCPLACDDDLGCVACRPGTGTCNGDSSTTCLADGSGTFEEYCDPLQGSSCGPAGVCAGPCSSLALGDSYIGCDYFPTVTGNYVSTGYQFAITVSNTDTVEASVTVDGGALASPVTFAVAPGSVGVQYLPWVPALKACDGDGAGDGCGPPQSSSAMVAGGAYHVRSSRPVTVYQFSPLDYQGAGHPSFTNDASLLLPSNAWSTAYVAASWPAWNGMPSQLAVTAVEDATEVTFVNRAATDMIPAGTPTVVTLNRGDVIQLMSMTGDLTGSSVVSSKRVQVIGGHYCNNVPADYPACDHLEESMFPIRSLSRDYLVTAPYLPGIGRGREQMIRVIATAPNTTVTLDPPIVGPTALAGAGEFLELSLRAEDIHITADQKIMVVTYLAGQDAPPAAGTGDPAMALAVPVEQYRNSYLFHAPANYETNWVNVTAPIGAALILDGVAVDPAALLPISSSGFGVARLQLAATGNHTMTGNQPFGISVYGYGQYTSYYYPGGLDLDVIDDEPVD